MKNIETTETVFGKGLTVNAAFDYATPALLDARSYVNRLEQMQEGEHDLFDNKLASGLLVYCAEDNKVYVFEGHDKNDNHRVWTALCTFDELNELGKFFNEQWTNLYNNTISDLYQKFGEVNGIAQEGLGRVKKLETFVDHFHTYFSEFQSEVFDKYVTWERIEVYLQNEYSTKEEINNTISEFYTSTVQTYINNKVTELTEQINNIDLSDYYNKTEIKNILEDFKSELADLTDDLRWEYLLSIVPKDKSYESIRESVVHTSNPITGNYIKQYNLEQDLSKASKDEKLSSELKRLLKGDKPFFVLAQLTKNVGTVAAGEYTKCNFKCHIAHKYALHTFDMDVSLLHVVTVNGEIKSCYPITDGDGMCQINTPVTHEWINNGVTRKYEYSYYGGWHISADNTNNNIDINHDFKSNDVVGNYLIARVDNIYERDYDGISPDDWYVWEGEHLTDFPENTMLFNSDKVELQISVDAEQDKDQRRELYTNGLILKNSNRRYIGLNCNDGIEYQHNKSIQRIDANGFKQSFCGAAPVGFNIIIAGVACMEENPEKFGGNLKFCSVENRPGYSIFTNTPMVRINDYKTFSVSPYGINPTYSVLGKHYEIYSSTSSLSGYNWAEDRGDKGYSYYCINLGNYDIPDNAILLASFNTLVRYDYDSEHPLQMMWATGGEHWHGTRYLQTTILRNKMSINQIDGSGSQLVFAVCCAGKARKGIGAINYMLVTPN